MFVVVLQFLLLVMRPELESVSADWTSVAVEEEKNIDRVLLLISGKGTLVLFCQT